PSGRTPRRARGAPFARVRVAARPRARRPRGRRPRPLSRLLLRAFGVGLGRERQGDEARQVLDGGERRARSVAEVLAAGDALAVRDPGAQLRPEPAEVDALRVARVARGLVGGGLHEAGEPAGPAAPTVVEPGGAS